MRKLIWLPISIVGCLIVYLLWAFTIKDFLPTPVPAHYKPVEIGQRVELPFLQAKNKPTLLHFFNPLCNCSLFNLDYVKKIVKHYHQQFHFVVVFQVADKDYDFTDLQNDLGRSIQYVIDDTGDIAQRCGVYSTPQAVILDSKQQLYYRGNYNRARYCTDKKTNFAQMAMDSLLAHKPAPKFSLWATQAYGCELPQNEELN